MILTETSHTSYLLPLILLLSSFLSLSLSLSLEKVHRGIHRVLPIGKVLFKFRKSWNVKISPNPVMTFLPELNVNKVIPDIFYIILKLVMPTIFRGKHVTSSRSFLDQTRDKFNPEQTEWLRFLSRIQTLKLSDSLLNNKSKSWTLSFPHVGKEKGANDPLQI